MKNNNAIFLDRIVSAAMAVAAAAALILLILSGCEENPFAEGSEIKFQAGSGPATKTEYGEIVGSGTDKVQRVDWLSGDQMRICCSAASEPSSKYADYRIKEGTITTDGSLSKAKISAIGSGLKWGSSSDAHTFYALYPSPAAGKTGDAIDKDGKMQGKIPATQIPDEVVIPGDASKPIVAKPVMTNQYMVAKTTKEAGVQSFADDEVALWFTPITTAIEFTVKNNYEDNQTLRIKSVSLISTSHNLSGSFSTDLLNNWSGTYPTTASGTFSDLTKEVKIDFTGETNGFVSLAKGNMLKFTFFLLPNTSPDDLVFKVVKKKADGEESDSFMKAAIVDKDGNGIEFDRCKKHFVSGVLLEEGAVWTVGFNPDVFSWDVLDPVDKTLDDPTATEPSELVPWGTGEEGDLDLTSTSYQFELENPDDATKTFSNPAETSSYDIPVTSVKTESGTPDDSHGWSVKSYVIGSGSPVAVTDNAFTIDGLTVAKSGKKLEVTDSRTLIDKASHEYWAGNNGNWSPAAKTATTDLSKYDFETDQTRTKMRTANCYVIRHAGTYRIPLVYGNAIDEEAVSGGMNSAAYAGVSGGLSPFLNSLNKAITDPFIENHTYDGNAIKSNHKTDLVATSASVVWQDEAAVISNVSIYTPSTGQKNAGSYDKSNVRYIEFTVNSPNICQNNAVIAVYGRDKDSQNAEAILWSWHIWVTNDPALLEPAISVTNATSKTYDFFPLPCLGWIEPPYYEVKDDVVVTLQQEESDKTVTVTIKRPAFHYPGNGTYYQYGRKDPMPRKDNLVGGTVSTMTRTDVAGTSGVILGVSIWHPQTFYYSSNGNFGNWSQTKYNNLWTGKYNTSGTSVDNNASTMIKTVYDPCPVGYKVPASKAFTAFSTLPSTPMSELNGFTFQAGDRTIFFPACGMRTYKATNFGISGGVNYSAGDVARLGLNAYYVTAISADSSADSGEYAYSAFTLGFNKSAITTENRNVRANGMSVRPVKE